MLKICCFRAVKKVVVHRRGIEEKWYETRIMFGISWIISLCGKASGCKTTALMQMGKIPQKTYVASCRQKPAVLHGCCSWLCSSPIWSWMEGQIQELPFRQSLPLPFSIFNCLMYTKMVTGEQSASNFILRSNYLSVMSFQQYRWLSRFCDKIFADNTQPQAIGVYCILQKKGFWVDHRMMHKIWFRKVIK